MTLTEGTYNIADDCRAKYKDRTLIVYKMTKKQIEQSKIKRCRDCVHQKTGKLCMRNQWWESTYCELKPKTISGVSNFFYNAPDNRPACESFKEKAEG